MPFRTDPGDPGGAGTTRERGPRERGPRLRLAAYYLPKRGTCKVAYLMGLYLARSAIRRLGGFLAEQGHLEADADACYLAIDEIRGTPPADAKRLVTERRAIRQRYQHFDVPDAWAGMCDPIRPERDHTVAAVEGSPASPGIVEGLARVVTDPSHATVEPGEILFARDTDPSWASLLFLSPALVADIGGVMSHTAVVARELGIPCVVDTKIATRVICTGDRVRVDGARGRIDVVERA